MKIPEMMRMEEEERILKEHQERTDRYARVLSFLQSGKCDCPSCRLSRPGAWASIKQLAA